MSSSCQGGPLQEGWAEELDQLGERQGHCKQGRLPEHRLGGRNEVGMCIEGLYPGAGCTQVSQISEVGVTGSPMSSGAPKR